MDDGGDWMKRNFHEYTHSSSENSFQLFKNGRPYSRGLVKLDNKMTPAQIAQQVRDSVDRVLATMASMTPEQKAIRATFSPNVSFANTHTTSVMVNVEPFSEKNATIFDGDSNKALDVTLGFAVHEALHILRTKQGYTPIPGNGTPAEEKFRMKLEQMFWDLIEDERIEAWGGDNVSGYMPYVAAAKRFVFEKNKESRKDTDGALQDPNLQEILEFMETLYNFVRYPGALERDLVNKYEKELRLLKGRMTPFPKTEQEVNDLARFAYSLVEDKVKNIEQKPPEKEQDGGKNDDEQQDEKESGKDGDSGSDADSKDKQDNEEQSDDEQDNGSVDTNKTKQDEKKDSGDGDEEEKPENNSGKDENGSSDEQNQYGEDGGNGEEQDAEPSNTPDSGNTNAPNQQKQDADKAKQDALREKLAKYIESLSENDLSAQQEKKAALDQSASALKISDYQLQAVEKGSIKDFDEAKDPEDFVTRAHEFPGTENLHSHRIPIQWVDKSKPTGGDLMNSEYQYKSAVRDVASFASGLRARLSRLNRNHNQTNFGQFEGELDDTRLAETRMRTSFKNFYKQEFKIKNPGAVIVGLCDESGSMQYAQELARRVAVMFERATDGLNGIDFFWYGHTTGNLKPDVPSTVIFRYYEGRKTGNAKCLGQVSAYNANRDGHAILETALRVRRQLKDPSKKIIMFVISDGEPSASVPQGYTEETYVRKCVEYLEKYQNCEIIHIAIQPGIPSAKMFNQFVTFTNFATLVRDIGGLLEKVIKKANRVV